LGKKERIEKEKNPECKQERKLRKKPGLFRGIQQVFSKELLKGD
jgi:hypothetical protein